MSNNKLPKNILNKLNTLDNLQFFERSSNFKDWDLVLEKLDYCPFLYTNASIKYQEAYRSDSFSEYLDLSAVIKFKDEFIGILPLAIAHKNKQYLIFSQTYLNGLDEPPPLDKPIFAKFVSTKIKKQVSCEIYKILKTISKLLDIDEYKISDNFEGSSKLSDWHILSMELGSQVNVIHELYVDLTLDINTIKSKFRKSYKSLIKEDKFKLKTYVMTKNDTDIWREFKNMHLKAAGRITRSEKSWRMHFEDITNDCGLLIYVRDHKDLFLGGGFFNYSKDEANYSVAAYDRGFFHLPIGHIVQFRAIKEFQKKGLKWYKLGHLPFKGDMAKPSEKYMNIGNFKKGFATNIFSKFVFINQN